jgi:hypothetical protein
MVFENLVQRVAEVLCGDATPNLVRLLKVCAEVGTLGGVSWDLHLQIG